jgi:hypothetical protein
VKIISKPLAELQRPLPRYPVAHLDALSSEHLLDYAQIKREPEVQPDGMADHLSREAVASVTSVTIWSRHLTVPTSHHLSVKLTCRGAHARGHQRNTL